MTHKSDLTSPLYPGSGDPLAHLSLARCYTKGNGVEQSYEKAFQHHLKASESGTQRVSLTTQARPLFIIHNNSLSLWDGTTDQDMFWRLVLRHLWKSLREFIM